MFQMPCMGRHATSPTKAEVQDLWCQQSLVLVHDEDCGAEPDMSAFSEWPASVRSLKLA